MQTQLQNTKLNLIPDDTHEFLLPNKDVALGYDISVSTLRSNLNNNKDELIEGKHWLRLEVQTNGGKQKVIHWTKKGIVRLGFFIKSKKAKEFRDWAEDYIVEDRKQPDPQTVEQLQSNIEKLLAQNAKLQNQLSSKPKQEPQIPNDVLKLIDKGLKYDKLNDDYCRLYESYSELKINTNVILEAISKVQNNINASGSSLMVV